jgi:hypothetical protein
LLTQPLVADSKSAASNRNSWGVRTHWRHRLLRRAGNSWDGQGSKFKVPPVLAHKG